MFKKIVVGTDGSAGANMAVDAAIELARLTGATLHIVNAHRMSSSYHVAAAAEVGVPTEAMASSDEFIRAEGQKICDEVVERAARVGVQTETHCVSGDPADSLVKVASDGKCDLVVVGNRGMTGARRFVLGSVPNRLSHHCATNLLIVDTGDAHA